MAVNSELTFGSYMPLRSCKKVNGRWWSSSSHNLFMNIHVPRNLRICAISRLHCTFSESRDCVPVSRLRSQSRDCVTHTRNLRTPDSERCVACRMEDSLDKASIGGLLRSGRVSNAVCWKATDGFRDVSCRAIQSCCASTYLKVVIFHIWYMLAYRASRRVCGKFDRTKWRNGKARSRRHRAALRLARSRVGELSS